MIFIVRHITKWKINLKEQCILLYKYVCIYKSIAMFLIEKSYLTIIKHRMNVMPLESLYITYFESSILNNITKVDMKTFKVRATLKPFNVG
jgi:hypothetical protein